MNCLNYKTLANNCAASLTNSPNPKDVKPKTKKKHQVFTLKTRNQKIMT